MNILHYRVFKFLFLFYLVFSCLFFIETVAVHFLPSFHSEGGLEWVRLSIMLFVVLSLFFVVKRVIKEVMVVAVLLGSIILLSSVSGLFFNGYNHAFLTHTQYYSSFLLTYVLCAHLVKIDADLALRFIRKISLFCLFLIVVVLVKVHSEMGSGSRISLAIYIIGVPASYYLSRNKFGFAYLFSIGLALLSIKRSIWLASLVQLLIYATHMNKKNVFLGLGKLLCIFVVVVFVVIVVYFVEGSIVEGFLSKIATAIDVRINHTEVRALNKVDEFTSGRLVDVFAILFALESNSALHTGLGFGAMYDSYAVSGHGYLGSWIKSGSDIIFAHFWLIHGVWVGSILFGCLVVFIVRAYLFMIFSGDEWYRFLFYFLLFTFINSLFSFVAWDPIWGITIGLMYARRCQLKRSIVRVSGENFAIE